MNDEIAHLLRCLHLGAIAECLDEEIAAANANELTHQELIARLLRAQWRQQQEAALAGRIRRAKMPERWTLESFPYKQQPGVDRRQIRTLAELDFVAKAENIVFIGPTGVGKTGLATGLRASSRSLV